MSEQQKNVQEPDLNQLRKVRREKLSELQANGKDPYQIMRYDVSCHAMDIKENFEEMEGKQVSVAGRIMQKRVMGKASFCNVLDQSGNIQHWRRGIQRFQENGYWRHCWHRRRSI